MRTGMKCVKKIIIIEGLFMYICRVEDRIGNGYFIIRDDIASYFFSLETVKKDV